MITDEQYNQAMQNLYDYHQEIEEHNRLILSEFGPTAFDDFQQLIEGCNVVGKIEFVDAPMGYEQCNDPCGVFSEEHVDQHSVGDSGDSYAGFIYVKVSDKWIRIPYEC